MTPTTRPVVGGGEAPVRRRIVAASSAVVAALGLLAGLVVSAHQLRLGGTAVAESRLFHTSSTATSETSAPPSSSSSSEPPSPTGSSTTTTKPTTPAPTTTPPPSNSGVGVPPGTQLHPSGSLTVDTPGTVLDALDVHGSVVITAPNVVVKRSRFTGTGTTPWAIQTRDAGSVLIEDVTIEGNYTDAGIAYANWTAERVEIVGMTNDGAKMGNNVTIRDSWIHGFHPEDGAHADGLQLTEDVGNILVQHNQIDPGGGIGANSAIFLSPDLGPQVSGAGPVTLDGNVLGGGGYTLYVVGGANGAELTDVHVLNNRFLRDAQYGPIRAEKKPVAQANNCYVDGEAIPWPA